MREDFVKKGGSEKEWKAKWASYSDVCNGLQSYLIFTQFCSVRRSKRRRLCVISMFPFIFASLTSFRSCDL